MVSFKVEKNIGGRMLCIETGKIAKQAEGAVTVRYGDTLILATVVSTTPRKGIDFFPLTVDYRERMYAAGKFPGGFVKRESRPGDKETLVMRLCDRPIRPLFPEGFRDDLLIQILCYSYDQENDPDILAMNGASACLLVSPIPFKEPTGAVRVGRIDGEFIINPTQEQLKTSDLDAIIAGDVNQVSMLEIGASEIPEDELAAAIDFGHQHVKQICAMMKELADQVAPEKPWQAPEPNTELIEKVRAAAVDEFYKVKTMQGAKLERQNATHELRNRILDEFAPEDATDLPYERTDVMDILEKIEEEVVTDLIVNQSKRPDGRALDEIRELSCEIEVLPRAHGSAIFTRGETMALVSTTLGTSRDMQRVDDLGVEFHKRFYMHYNFPSFSVGEVKMPRGPSRRDIGHGALAERALTSVMPSLEEFPYTVRVVSEILESNGSSSMASVCGGTLSVMDAGVPIKDPVAGISVGMFHTDEKWVLVTDIAGEEDHYGDMDFKVAGTQNGVTAVQLDLKIRGISREVIVAALERAREARMKLLREMLGAISAPREEISKWAPRLLTIKIDPEKIGKVIGPGGRGIRALEAETGASIDIEDDGTIQVSCTDAKGAKAAVEKIELITEDVKVDKIYTGRVISIKDFGAFIEIAPGQDGLCHISELSNEYVKNVQDVVKLGDEVQVKVIAIDDQGRVKLSRKQAQQDAD
ncbi:MAG: polyribonucleotide nucleotidyltransferase [Phycisphaerae bacterium]|nr:polyribonucleotide nucleotidyltransferase [Phycisphaerae bacterium]